MNTKNCCSRIVRNNLLSAFLFVLGIGLSSNACAAPTTTKTDDSSGVKITHEGVHVAKGDLTDLILRSKEVLKSFTVGDNPIISSKKLESAECVVVFPTVTRAALVVGGQHGDGVATCKDAKDNQWSRLGFVDLRGASLGAQVGVEQTKMVVVLNNEKAREQLKRGKMRFAADVSYVFGDQEASKTASTDKRADVQIFSDSRGAFASASLEGSYIAADEGELASFYRDEVSTLYATLSAKPSDESKAVVRELLVLLPSKGSAS